MSELSLLMVTVAAIATFFVGFAYYAVLGKRLAAARPGPGLAEPPVAATGAIELIRSAVLAAVVCGVAAVADVAAIGTGLLLGLVLWIGFPLVLWVGAIVHERTPVGLAVIHSGDWLVKLLVIGAIAGAFG